MVRLKQTFAEFLINHLKESQFHYGSIKTPTSVRSRVVLPQPSQFHYGSIKTAIKWNDIKVLG